VYGWGAIPPRRERAEVEDGPAFRHYRSGLQSAHGKEQRKQDQRDRKILPQKQVLYRPSVARIKGRVQDGCHQASPITSPQRARQEKHAE